MQPLEPNDGQTRPPAWRRYLRFWRSAPRADVAEELQFHLDSAAAEYVAAGMSREAAQAEATRRFGDVSAITRTLYTLSEERERAMQLRDWVDTVRQDVRVAFRRLRQSPGFTAVVIFTLALGIGANSAIFSVVHAVLLEPLPYRNAERLLNLREGNGPDVPGGMFVTFGNYGAWTQEARSFEAFAGYFTGASSLALTGVGEPQQIRVTRATASYWKAMYIPPVVGRYFDPADDKVGTPKVVVLSHALWQSAFGGDSGIVGKSITLGADAYVVRGVASPRYALTPQAAAAWVPLVITPEMLSDHSDHELNVVGLVRAGVPIHSALAELTRVQQDLHRRYPNASFDGTIVATSLLDALVGPASRLLKILFGAVAVVLLIACVNIANLLLARAAARRKEIAVRGALGAGRGRIVAQLLVESLLLAGAGAGVGLGVAALGTRFLVHNGPQSLPRLRDASVDGTVLLFTIGVGLVSGVAFGLLPALRASRLNLQSTLRESGRTDAAAARQPLRAALVVMQVSLALVLLVGAGLLVRSAMLLQRVPPGFDPSNVFVGGLALPNARYSTDTAAAARFDEILRAVSAVPGVKSAAVVNRIAIGAGGADCSARAEGTAGNSIGADMRTASSAYFMTLGIPMVFGRSFTAADRAGGPPVVVINRRLARALFGVENAVGKRILSCGPTEPAEVVGVTGDIHANGLASGVRDQVYYASTQVVQRGMTLVVRGAVPVTTLAPSIRQAVNALDPLLPIGSPRTMEEIIRQTLATPRFQSGLLAVLSAAGLLLAVIGIYGVIAILVVQRTQEFAVRMALGAHRSQVLVLVMREGMALALLGIAAGVVASIFATRLMEEMLFGVESRDPLTFAAAALLLAATALASNLVPAWRATRVDPLVAMRA